MTGKSMSQEIVIARDFSQTPGGRSRRMGPKSGEEFRDLIISRLRQFPGELTVILDGVDGYGSSFLEEAFGGLFRQKEIPVNDIRTRVHVVARAPAFVTYKREAEDYMRDADRK